MTTLTLTIPLIDKRIYEIIVSTNLYEIIYNYVMNESNKDTAISELASKRKGLQSEMRKLLNVSWSDLNTFFLGLYEKRIKKIKPSDLVVNYLENDFLKISNADPRKINKIENLLFSILPSDYNIIDISPVSPIGINAVLAKINSKTSLSTIRNLEVLSDPTTQLALEATKMKLADKNLETINLATAVRLLRTQRFNPSSGMTNHFKAFALATSGKNIGNRQFEYSALKNQLIIWLEFLSKSKKLGYKASNISVAISNTSIIDELSKAGIVNKKNIIESIRYNKESVFVKDSVDLTREIKDITDLKKIEYDFLHNPIETLKRAELDFIKDLRISYPEINFYYRLDRIAGSAYYSGLCFKIYAETSDGTKHALVDGGVSDWNKHLLQNNKEMIFTSGFGSELFSNFFN